MHNESHTPRVYNDDQLLTARQLCQLLSLPKSSFYALTPCCLLCAVPLFFDPQRHSIEVQGPAAAFAENVLSDCPVTARARVRTHRNVLQRESPPANDECDVWQTQRLVLRYDPARSPKAQGMLRGMAQ